jgi:predicted dehydrogenase
VRTDVVCRCMFSLFRIGDFMSNMQEQVDLMKEKNSNALRVAIIGFGKVALSHFEAIRLRRDVRLVGFSTNDKRIQSGDSTHLENNMGVKGCLFKTDGLMTNGTDNWKTLLEKTAGIDAFIVCTPTEFHHQIAVAVAEAGKHCFLEKPMAMTALECSQVLSAFKTSAGRLVVGHVLPAFPQYNFLYKLLQKHPPLDVLKLELNRHVGWDCVYAQPDISRSTGFAPDLGVHDMNFLLHWITDNTHSVQSEAEWMFDKPQHLRFSPRVLESLDTQIILDLGASRHCAGFKHSWNLELKNGQNYWFDGVEVWDHSDRSALPQKVQIAPLTIPEVFSTEYELAVPYWRKEVNHCSFLNPQTSALTVMRSADAVAHAWGCRRK